MFSAAVTAPSITAEWCFANAACTVETGNVAELGRGAAQDGEVSHGPFRATVVVKGLAPTVAVVKGLVPTVAVAPISAAALVAAALVAAPVGKGGSLVAAAAAAASAALVAALAALVILRLVAAAHGQGRKAGRADTPGDARAEDRNARYLRKRRSNACVVEEEGCVSK